MYPGHQVDPPNNQLANRLVGEGFLCMARLTASNMEAYLFKKYTDFDKGIVEEKIVLIRHGIAELFKEK